jgi:4-hydroxythreonine-4-phosphate dehydrogenase
MVKMQGAICALLFLIHSMTPANTGIPRIGITMGDPAGVGPEVVLKAIARHGAGRSARLVVIGSQASLEYYNKLCGFTLRIVGVDEPGEAAVDDRIVHVADVGAPAFVAAPGVVDARAGALAVAALRRGAEWCRTGAIDALVTAPVSKSSMHLAGCRVEGQTEMLGEAWGGGRYGMLVVADALRILILTRHMSLRDALSKINIVDTVEHLQLLHDTLLRLGIPAPKLALAAWNPHAGEGGLFGSEDDQILVPAVGQARARGLSVAGPVPADSLFGRAWRGEFDGVLSLYHDQALIAPKALAPDRAVTVIAGAPFLRVSVIHGAGFDRAGRNAADATNMAVAIARAAEWAPRWNATRATAQNGTKS